MSTFRDLMYIEHILESIAKIQSYTKGLDEDGFHQSDLIQDGVIRQFEIIGEASKRISENLKAEYPRIPWKDMVGMRDILIHNYMQVEIDIVWETVVKFIPNLLTDLEEIKAFLVN